MQESTFVDIHGGIVTNGSNRALYVAAHKDWLPPNVTEYKGVRTIEEGDNVLEAFGEPHTTELYTR